MRVYKKGNTHLFTLYSLPWTGIPYVWYCVQLVGKRLGGSSQVSVMNKIEVLINLVSAVYMVCLGSPVAFHCVILIVLFLLLLFIILLWSDVVIVTYRNKVQLLRCLIFIVKNHSVVWILFLLTWGWTLDKLLQWIPVFRRFLYCILSVFAAFFLIKTAWQVSVPRIVNTERAQLISSLIEYIISMYVDRVGRRSLWFSKNITYHIYPHIICIRILLFVTNIPYTPCY